MFSLVVDGDHNPADALGDDRAGNLVEFSGEPLCGKRSRAFGERRGPGIAGIFKAGELDVRHAGEAACMLRVALPVGLHSGLNDFDDGGVFAGAAQRKRQRRRHASLSDVGVGSGYKVARHRPSSCASISIWSSVWSARIVMRSRDVPGGTVGGRIAGTKMRCFNSSSETRSARSSLPRGMETISARRLDV